MFDLPPILQEVIKRQEESRLSDSAFANKLGIGYSLWEKTKRGAVPLRWRVATLIVAAYPDLKPALADFMEDEGLKNRCLWSESEEQAQDEESA